MKTIGITGICGFMGRHLAEACLKQGYKVSGLDINGAGLAKLSELGAHVIEGSVLDESAIGRFCQGVDVVVHTAAVMKEDGAWSDFRAINVQGTETVARLASQNGVRGFIHVSSVMVYGYNYPQHVDEDGPLNGENNPYCQTKIESEVAALKFHSENQMSVTVVRPGDVYGRGSVPWVLRPLEMLEKRMLTLPGRGEGLMNPIHIDDLVRVYMDIIEQENYGDIFNVTDGQPVSFYEYFSRLAKIGGKKAPRRLPYPLLLVAFLFIPKTIATRSAIDFVRRPYAYSNERVRNRLGFKPRVSLEDGLADIERWLSETSSDQSKV
ncbi:MAG: NAD-dependent epimerase/dehydratase family protein [Myxococcota bacterium]|nr:NAD-dependent epimerase/dehydratase family protein [Myxococcota bacterium]